MRLLESDCNRLRRCSECFPASNEAKQSHLCHLQNPSTGTCYEISRWLWGYEETQYDVRTPNNRLQMLYYAVLTRFWTFCEVVIIYLLTAVSPKSKLHTGTVNKYTMIRAKFEDPEISEKFSEVYKTLGNGFYRGGDQDLPAIFQNVITFFLENIFLNRLFKRIGKHLIRRFRLFICFHRMFLHKVMTSQKRFTQKIIKKWKNWNFIQ